jgi:hypothetical protein
MPNPNAIVSTTIRLSPSLDRDAAEVMLRRDEGITVELEGERRVRLDPADPRSPGFAQVLDGLSKQGLPVYIEVDPASDAITRMLVPNVARVVAVEESGGALDVRLDASHARHVLPLDDPDAPDLAERLRSALRERHPVIVVGDDSHRIIEVREYTPDPEGPLPPFGPTLPPKPKPVWWLPPWLDRLIRRIWWWIRWPWWWWFGCVSATRAQEVFDDMATRTCAPLTVPPPCIPFMYPDDGCWARAHEMCRLMLGMGLSPNKVWIACSPGHYLHALTKNHPQCFVDWGWHVAPTLCVRGPGWFASQRMVIDPSLCTTPVTEAAWKGLQGDPGATLTDTGPDQFWPSGGTDPTYSSTNATLQQYRLALQNRSNQVGPPPYANC